MVYQNKVFGHILEIIECFVSIFSVCFNLLLAHILANRLRLIQSDTVVSFILCMLDTSFSLFSIANFIINLATNYDLINKSTEYCQINGFVLTAFGSCIVDVIMVLGLLRYLAICKNKLLPIRSWVFITSGILFFTLSLGISASLTQSFKVQPSLKYCSYNRNYYVANIIGYIVGVKSLFNVLLVCFSYVFIGQHYKTYISQIKVQNSNFINMHSSKDLSESSSNLTNSDLVLDYYKVEKSVKRSVFKLYIMLFIYLAQLVPFGVIQSVYGIIKKSPDQIVDQTVDSLVSFISNSMTLANPLFILFFHEETNMELKAIVTICWFRVLKFFNMK